MLEDLESAEEIKRLTDQLLRRADVYGRLPTPVDDILAAAELTEVPDGFLTINSIASAPAHLRAALSRARGKVHAALDRKTREVHINPETDLKGQGAFKRLHETAHALFPWQQVDVAGVQIAGFADDALTLSPRTNRRFEQEANQGAAELLFQRGRFAQLADEYEIGCAAVAELGTRFGASRHASFRRYVESHRGLVAGVVLDPVPCARDPLGYRRREAVCSRAWRRRFEDPTAWPKRLEHPSFAFVDQARACAGFGPPTGEWRHHDRANEPVDLRVEAMSNTYRTFVLIWHPRRELFKRRRHLAEAA